MNFFMSVECKKPPFTRAILIDRSKFCEHFRKGSPKEHSCEIISKSEKRFLRIFSCPYSAKSPHSPEPYL